METECSATRDSFRKPKGERRVRFADTMGMELASIFLFDFISNYYIAKTIRDQNQNLNKQITSSNNTHQKPTLPLPQPPPAPTLSYKQHQQYHYNLQQLKQQQQQQQQLQQQQQQNHQSSFKPSSLQQYHSSSNTYHQYESYNKSQSNQSGLVQSNHLHQNNSHLLPQQQQQQQQQTSLTKQHHFYIEFTQPISLVSFKERVRLNKVHLETCHVNSTAGHVSVSCTIRVLNLAFDKSILVRYTTDEWHTFADSLASYVPGSNDGCSDKFTSTFSVTNRVKQFQSGQRIMFAIRYTVNKEQEFWDNNGGLNYSVKVT